MRGLWGGQLGCMAAFRAAVLPGVVRHVTSARTLLLGDSQHVPTRPCCVQLVSEGQPDRLLVMQMGEHVLGSPERSQPQALYQLIPQVRVVLCCLHCLFL